MDIQFLSEPTEAPHPSDREVSVLPAHRTVRSGALLLALAFAARAGIPFLADTSSVYDQSFNTLPASGSAEFSALPEGWSATETGTNANTQLAANNGSSNAGNTYSYGTNGDSDRALGSLASGSIPSIRLGFRIVNATGGVVDTVRVRFRAEQWRLGGSTTDSLAARWSVNGGPETPAPGLTVLKDLGNGNSANPQAQATSFFLGADIPAALADGDTLVLTWVDTNAASNDDAWAIDDFSLGFGARLDSLSDSVKNPPELDLAIHAIQGPGDSSPYLDSSARTTGVVTGVFTGPERRKGFFVQTPVGQEDADPATSEGILVYTGGTDPGVAMGDSVTVSGKVEEYNGTTEITGSTTTIHANARPLPDPVLLSLPFEHPKAPERFEGMRVSFSQNLVVTGNYGLGRYGEFVVAPRRIMAPTQVSRPGADALAASRADSLSRLVVDDGSVVQNPATVPYPVGGLSASRTLRAGDKIGGLEGILDWQFGQWTLQPTRSPVFTVANPRSSAPVRSSGKLRVASLNVLNYFTTPGTSAACGPERSLECRGAGDPTEFQRQKAKILSALKGLDADIVGLVEIENHPTDSALDDLLQGLRDSTATSQWEKVATGPVGGDAIKVALLYRKDRVTASGDPATLTSAKDPGFSDRLHRVPVAQTFAGLSGSHPFTVVVNHLKSKGSACADFPDLGDGQGNCSGARTAGARALAAWVKSRPTGTVSPDALLIGDFNAYAKEDPIVSLQDSGFVDLVHRDHGDSSYSYQFGNAFGTLDYALATPGLAAIAGASHWAINADEPVALGYDTEYKSAEQIASYYAPDAFGASDHDPVVVELDLGTTPVASRKSGTAVRLVHRGGRVLLSAPGSPRARVEILAFDGSRLATLALDASGNADISEAGSGVRVVRISEASGRLESLRLAIP